MSPTCLFFVRVFYKYYISLTSLIMTSQLQDSLRELDELLQEPFRHSCTQLDARNQLEHGRPVLQELHGSHEQCKSHGNQFIEMTSSEVEHNSKSHGHVSRYDMCIYIYIYIYVCMYVLLLCKLL